MIKYKIPRPARRGIFLISLTVISLLSSLSAAETATVQIPSQGVDGSTSLANGVVNILALRVSFEPDSNLSTSGNGQFLEAGDQSWCDGFIIDPGPHDVAYFYDQLQAVSNYFAQVSHNKLIIDIEASSVYPMAGEPPITLAEMATYTTNEASGPVVDSLLVQLAVNAFDAIDPAAVHVTDYDMVIIFHAGLGQDFAYTTLDPTPRDLPSSYIDPAMFQAALGTPGIPIGNNEQYTDPVLLVPESQNHLFYDTAQDLFGYVDDLCDSQIGLTGTLALLMGYGLGFPPLFDTVTGEPGVGVFALMDAGSGNGRGIMPAPPDPWTRIMLGWEDPVDLADTNTLAARHLPDGKIGKLILSPSEYLLIENRSNWVGDAVGVDLDSMLFRDAVDQGSYLEFPHYFGHVTDSLNVNRSENNVITSVENYDWGLPGSGLLIWQVNEAVIAAGLQGVNNDRNRRGIRLIEADGAIDIGFPTSALFERPDLGWRWDMWYAGNDGYFTGNPSLGYENPLRLLMLDSQTNPPLALQSGATTGLAIGPIGPADTAMTFAVGSDREITWLQPGSAVIGHNGVDWIHQRNDSLWVGARLLDDSVAADWQIYVRELDHLNSGADSAFWLIDTSNSVYAATRYFSDTKTPVTDNVPVNDAHYTGDMLILLVGEPAESPNPDLIEYLFQSPPAGALIQSSGYLTSRTEIQPATTEFDGTEYRFNGHSSKLRPVLADIDGDGLDEILTIDDAGPGQLGAFNWAGTNSDDFPIFGNFDGPILVANLDDDPAPEIVVIESGDIVVYNIKGDELMRFARRGLRHPFLHEDGARIGLADGDRIIWFEPATPNPFWLTESGQASRERYSLNGGITFGTQANILDKRRVYNYPNPVLGDATIIRFYVGTANSAHIRFYTLDGLKVDEADISASELHQNDYNEWRWDVSALQPGLYYALVEVSGTGTESALVKIAIIK